VTFHFCSTHYCDPFVTSTLWTNNTHIMYRCRQTKVRPNCFFFDTLGLILINLVPTEASTQPCNCRGLYFRFTPSSDCRMTSYWLPQYCIRFFYCLALKLKMTQWRVETSGKRVFVILITSINIF